MIDFILREAEINYQLGEHEGRTFFIFNSVSDVKIIEAICPMELLQKECDFDWGYSDEYDFCPICGEIVKINPNCCTKEKGFVEYGKVICPNCLDISI